MAIQINKMILHGILNAITYIALPLILFEVISMMGLMTFSQEFKMSIIIIGIIGTVFAMLRHAYPKDTSANRLMAFGSTIYSGIYMFYIFGGFTPGVQLGTYSISILNTLEVLLGLQVIAWLLLGSSGIRALRYLIEAIEFRKKKEYRVKFKLSKIFKVLGTIFSLIIFGYLGSIIYSGMNLSFNFHPTFDLDHDGGVLPGPSDDSINITVTFDLDNQGLYAIYDVYIDAEFRTIASANETALPVGVKVGESKDNYFSTFHSFTNNVNNSITIVMDPTYIVGLATTDATLAFKISFSTLYASIFINLNITVNIPWNSLI